MKKIAIFSNNLSVGGIQKSLYNLLRNIDYSKYEIDLYLMNKENFYKDNLPKQLNMYYLKKHNSLHKFLPFSLNRLIYKYEGNNKKYDISIDFDGYQQITAINAIKCNAKKHVMWIHNNMLEKKKHEKKFRVLFYFSKDKNKYFDEYVGVSNGVIEPFKIASKLDEINYTIIPNIIDTDEIYEKIKEDCELEVDNLKYNFCSLGRVCKAKGFDNLIKYLNDLRNLREDFHFYLIGDGEEMPKIKKLVSLYKLEKYVTLLGTQKNPYKYMNKMDGFILTSRYEGQGMVLLEAKALGLELFVTKNLEQYNTDLEGCIDIVDSMNNAKKRSKKYDNLQEYNQNIMNGINKLINKEV